MKTIEIKCLNNGKTATFRQGISLRELADELKIKSKMPLIAALVNNRVCELNYVLYKSKTIHFFDMTTPSGMRIYIRSLCFILYKAICDLYPEARLRIEHPISKGYFWNITGVDGIVDLESIKQRMQEIIAEDLPFEYYEEESEIVFGKMTQQNLIYKVLLLKNRNHFYTAYNELGGNINYFFGTLVPSTAYIHMFDVIRYYKGFLLRVPSREEPEKLEEMTLQSKMFEIFKENASWNKILGFSNVGDLNESCAAGSISQTIKIGEALHEKKIALIADAIIDSLDDKRMVLISGPSSSGKTTFSKRLAIQLQVLGKRPVSISMDNYFVDREHTPKDENGEYDFESLDSLDLNLFQNDISSLLKGDVIDVPNFNFSSGKRIYRGEKMKIDKSDILIIEGIHALNPQLTESINDKIKFKIYVSALTTHSLDDHNWISTGDTRLIRRITRDYKYRGYSPEETISRWDSIQRGENKWIFPFQENADMMFNSALIFELSVIREQAEPILREVPQNSPQYPEAQRLLRFISYFIPAKDVDIPNTSLLREFLGGSSFEY